MSIEVFFLLWRVPKSIFCFFLGTLLPQTQTQNLLYCVFFTFKYYMFMVNIKHFPSSKDSSLSERLSVEYTCTHMNNPPFSSTFDLSPAEQRTSSEVHLDTKVLSAPSKHKEAVNPPSLFIWGLVHSLKTKILSRQQGPGVDYQNRSCFHACFGFRMSVHVHEMFFFSQRGHYPYPHIQ